MKFDSFLKYAGGDGVIFTAECGEKWLFFDKIGMRIPEGKGVLGTVAKMPEYLEDLIYDREVVACELSYAYVPRGDSKPSEIKRVFTGTHGLSIDISNKAFGFIEKKDNTYITDVCIVGEHDNTTTTCIALLVTDDYGDVEDLEFKMIVIHKEENENE